MDIKNSLIEFGFSKNEAAVYLALLELGTTQAGPLVKKTRLHRMKVYNALEKFVEEGYCTIVRKKNIKMFTATDPSALQANIKRKEALVTGILPNLKELQQKHDQLVDVRTMVGQEGFTNNLKDILDSTARQKDKTMRIIGGGRGIDFYKALGSWYDDYVELCETMRIKKMLVVPAQYLGEFMQKFGSEKATELRSLPEGLNTPMYTRVTQEMVSFEIYQPQLFVIQIRNEVLARNYMDSFELLWKTSK